MVKTYEEWKTVVAGEVERLRDVEGYLNEVGRERLDAFEALNNLACFAYSPQELVEIYSEDLGKGYDPLKSRHINSAVKCIKRLAGAES